MQAYRAVATRNEDEGIAKLISWETLAISSSQVKNSLFCWLSTLEIGTKGVINIFTSLRFSGHADHWYQFYRMGRFKSRWVTFIEDVCARFENINHENTVVDLFALVK